MGVETAITTTESGKRTAKRSRVLLAAKLDTPSGEVEARLRDLSRKGALVEVSKPLEVGTEVTFMRGSTVVPARVAWAGSGRLGLEFHYLIDDQEVLVQLKRKKSEPNVYTTPDPTIGSHFHVHDRKRARAWGATVGLKITSQNF